MPDPLNPDPNPMGDPNPNPSPANWRETLPETIRGHKTLEKFQDPGALAQSYINLEQAHSKKLEGVVKIPGDGATPEEAAAFRQALGIPEDSTKYTLDVPEGLREIVPVEMAAKFAPVFHSLNIPPAVGGKIIQAYAEHAQALLAERQKEFGAGRDALKQEWGDATFERRMILAEKAAEHFLSDEQLALFNKAGLSGHPELVKLWAKLGEQMAEDGIISGEIVSAPSKAHLERRKMEIEADPDFTNQYKNPAKNALLVKEWNEVFAQLNLEPIQVSR